MSESGSVSGHAAIAKFPKKRLSKVRVNPELVPLQPVMDRDEVVIDVSIVVVARPRSVTVHRKAVLKGYLRLSSGSHLK